MTQLKEDFAAPGPDKLIAGDFPIVTEGGAVASGAGVLPRGAVLGRITASGKLAPVDKSKTDGSQTVYGVLAAAVDATAADAAAAVYLTGQFAASALTFGGSDTAADHKAGARAVGIFITDTVGA